MFLYRNHPRYCGVNTTKTALSVIAYNESAPPETPLLLRSILSQDVIPKSSPHMRDKAPSIISSSASSESPPQKVEYVYSKLKI